jgi:hypothetical protein
MDWVPRDIDESHESCIAAIVECVSPLIEQSTA